ncbi:MAG: formate dehydrogenase accessory sulfurtransferase FdhD [Planctomycetes bacterium]|nr:formate dehydrogenase accessory sulfurtransferase FdhD [Planctomycetota bacterium]
MNLLTDDAAVSSPIHTMSAATRTGDRLDWVAVEAPLEIRIGLKPATVLMRTPGDDEELVRGFLFSEGIISRADEIVSLSRPPQLTGAQQGNVVAVELAVPRKARGLDRNFYSSSSCGVCGKKTIASLEVKGSAAAARWTVARSILTTLPNQLRAAQPIFAKTGGVHASGLFTPDGQLVAVREDVGRHNALDKLIGWALASGKIPLADYLLVVSGRVSYEIIQKAIRASLPVIAAVGAPSSLALELAERFHLTLVGFLRHDSMNIYANPERVLE